MVRLSYQISGQGMVDSSNQLLNFIAFVDAFNGEVIEVFDQTMSVKKTDYFSVVDNVSVEQRFLTKNSKSTNFRRNLFYADFDIIVRDFFNASIVYFSPNTSPTSVLREDVGNVSSAGAGITYLFRSLSNQTWMDFHATTTSSSLTSYVGLKGGLTSSNFFYSETFFGADMAVTDVVGHEWTYGYTQYTSNLYSRYQSGSLRVAFGDIFGESLDIMRGDQMRTVLRSLNQTCTSYDWRFRCNNLPIGTDRSYRWLIGEECGIAHNDSRLGAFRDMYYPECFGDPSTTYSSNYDCTGNGDETYTNAGVINRLFAVIVDGGIYVDPAGGSDLVVTGLGLTKSLNLFRKTMLSMTSVTNFPGFASILSNTCTANIGTTLYVPQSTYDATSTVFSQTLSSNDCNQVTTAITGAGLSRDESIICTPSWAFYAILTFQLEVVCVDGMYTSNKSCTSCAVANKIYQPTSRPTSVITSSSYALLILYHSQTLRLEFGKRNTVEDDDIETISIGNPLQSTGLVNNENNRNKQENEKIVRKMPTNAYNISMTLAQEKNQSIERQDSGLYGMNLQTRRRKLFGIASISLTVVMLVGGVILLVMGTEAFCAKTNYSGFHGLDMLLIGIFMILPGSYGVVMIWGIYHRWRGYENYELPSGTNWYRLTDDS
eukprot:gene12137-16248_t